MTERLTNLIESADGKDVLEIGLLALAIFCLLRLLGRTRGAGVVRGLGLVAVGLFLVAQLFIAVLDLTVLGRVLDYLLTAILVGLVVLFQPELRRGLSYLGRYGILRFLSHRQDTIAEKLATAAQAMSTDGVGALIAIERDTPLSAFVDTGERIDGEVSVLLLRSLFSKRSPLHDGAVIVCNGRLAAAACQLPLGQPPDSAQMGMRHRSALALSEETDAVLLVVSEETGQISLAIAGRLKAIPRDRLASRLAELLTGRSVSLPMAHKHAA